MAFTHFVSLPGEILPSRKLNPSSINHSDDGSEDNEESSGDFYGEPEIDLLGEPFDYKFKPKDRVWAKSSEGNWYPGQIINRAYRGNTRVGEGTYYSVLYVTETENTFRRVLSPLNADIKPDSPYIRKQLKAAGWL